MSDLIDRSALPTTQIKTVIDMFNRFSLPPDIPRMTFHECEAIGIPLKVVKALGLDVYLDTHDRDQLLFVATLVRLCAIEDRIERGDLKPAVDTVSRDEYDALLKRFRHLLESDFIRSFDQYDPQTQTYKRDIVEADNVDRVVRCEHCRAWSESAIEGLRDAGFCIVMMRHSRPDFYCAYGRRREDGSE